MFMNSNTNNSIVYPIIIPLLAFTSGMIFGYLNGRYFNGRFTDKSEEQNNKKDRNYEYKPINTEEESDLFQIDEDYIEKKSNKKDKKDNRIIFHLDIEKIKHQID